MKVTLEYTQIEVPRKQRGRSSSYRWTSGYYIICPNGKLFPPMTLSEAKLYCEQQGWTIERKAEKKAETEEEIVDPE